MVEWVRVRQARAPQVSMESAPHSNQYKASKPSEPATINSHDQSKYGGEATMHQNQGRRVPSVTRPKGVLFRHRRTPTGRPRNLN